MEVETREVEEGIEITVRADQKVALSVWDGETEEIYLPDVSGNDSTYYVEAGSSKYENGFQVVHRGDVDDIELISS